MNNQIEKAFIEWRESLSLGALIRMDSEWGSFLAFQAGYEAAKRDIAENGL